MVFIFWESKRANNSTSNSLQCTGGHRFFRIEKEQSLYFLPFRCISNTKMEQSAAPGGGGGRGWFVAPFHPFQKRMDSVALLNLDCTFNCGATVIGRC